MNDLPSTYPPDDRAEAPELWHAFQYGVEDTDAHFELPVALVAHRRSAAATDDIEID